MSHPIGKEPRPGVHNDSMTPPRHWGPFLALPTDILGEIPAYLPLSSTPQTLLALCLASRKSYEHFHSNLWSNVIFQDSSLALSTLRRLSALPSVPCYPANQIHAIRFKSRVEEEDDSDSIDTAAETTLHALTELVEEGRLPALHTLELNLRRFWPDHHTSLPGRDVTAFGEILDALLAAIRAHCPHVRSIELKGLADHVDDETGHKGWIHKSQLFQFKNLTELAVRFYCSSIEPPENLQIFEFAGTLSHSLRSLSLESQLDDGAELSPLFSMSFPRLQTLKLGSQSLFEPSIAMDFWRRHPLLETLVLPWSDDRQPKFTQLGADAAGTFLPRLRHLTVPWHDARALAPILPQLRSLEISQSANGQVPYLLREVIPVGLPNLRSLTVHQTADKRARGEGVLWYEDHSTGEFVHVERPRGAPRWSIDAVLDPSWMQSIIKACPYLEEFAIDSVSTVENVPEHYASIAPHLARLNYLRRFFYHGRTPSLASLVDSEQSTDQLLSSARTIAVACPLLEEVGDISATPPEGYVTVRVTRRDGSSEIADAWIELGPGLRVGRENNAFPVSNTCAALY